MYPFSCVSYGFCPVFATPMFGQRGCQIPSPIIIILAARTLIDLAFGRPLSDARRLVAHYPSSILMMSHLCCLQGRPSFDLLSDAPNPSHPLWPDLE